MKFNYFWFDGVAKSNFEKYLLPYYKDKEDLIFLEIGSFEGRSAAWLLENILIYENCRLIIIDTFQDSAEHDKEELEKIFEDNIEPWKDKIDVIIARSQDILIKFDKLFDFIYVDGSHKAIDVYIDAVNGFRLLKYGGIMAFDDYNWKGTTGRSEDTPKPGIDKFLRLYYGMYDLLEKGYQVWIIKKM
jgi:predicted O-methyltransferase YrrM